MAVRSLGYAVKTATDGLDAPETVGRPAAVADPLDMMMPRMDGEAVLTHARSNSGRRTFPSSSCQTRTVGYRRQKIPMRTAAS
jgi:CheY-like chemotaxis protein